VTDRRDVAATVPWMREGTARLLAVVDKLGDEDLGGPSTLPGWSRAHVVGHLARNAEALVRLATWAQTGVETPMYAEREQRAVEIERSAALPADTLRAQLADTAAALDTALTRLTAARWEAEVRSALGRAIPAAELPWMRIRRSLAPRRRSRLRGAHGRPPRRGGRPAPRRRHHGHCQPRTTAPLFTSPRPIATGPGRSVDRPLRRCPEPPPISRAG
jgi:uncharacterized protein (TIGR03083 family)